MTSTNTLIDNVFILDGARTTAELKLALEIVFRRIKALTQDEQIDLVDWIKDVLSKKVKNKKLVDQAFSMMEEGIMQGKREAAKALIGLLEDEIIAEKIGLKLEEVKKLH